mmetsp:Transcript_29711/g.86093  ORF Transcript_29711/g.86093 Transcript_29711/m.86093 type:complete len:282 (+) Transcript_29711:1364-2209(+)
MAIRVGVEEVPYQLAAQLGHQLFHRPPLVAAEADAALGVTPVHLEGTKRGRRGVEREVLAHQGSVCVGVCVGGVACVGRGGGSEEVGGDLAVEVFAFGWGEGVLLLSVFLVSCGLVAGLDDLNHQRRQQLGTTRCDMWPQLSLPLGSGRVGREGADRLHQCVCGRLGQDPHQAPIGSTGALPIQQHIALATLPASLAAGGRRLQQRRLLLDNASADLSALSWWGRLDTHRPILHRDFRLVRCKGRLVAVTSVPLVATLSLPGKLHLLRGLADGVLLLLPRR